MRSGLISGLGWTTSWVRTAELSKPDMIEIGREFLPVRRQMKKIETCVFFAPFGCFGHQRPSSRNSRRSKRAVITAMIPRVRCCASRLFGHSPLAFMKAILLTRCAPILHPRKKILVLYLSYTCPNTCPVLVLFIHSFILIQLNHKLSYLLKLSTSYFPFFDSRFSFL